MFERIGIAVKLWLAFVALVLVALLPAGLLVSRTLSDFYHRQVTDPLVCHTQRLADMLAQGPEVLSLAPIMGQMAGAQVYAVDAAGRPYEFPGRAQEGPGSDLVSQALAGEAVLSEGPAGSGALLVAGAPIPGPDRPAGAVFLLAPSAPLEEALGAARRVLLASVLGTLLLASGLALLLSRTLVHPVLRMEQAARAMARGDFAARVGVPGRDEIGSLGQAINALAADLERYEKSRREFLANVAHELRTPLSYIRGYSQALSEGVVRSEEDRGRYLRVIHEESLRLGALVDDLMDLTSVEEGGALTMNLAPLDLREPLEQAAATLRPRAEAKGVRVVVRLPPDLPPVQADGGRIQQVAFNLLDNALRHTPAGGLIQVTAALAGGSVRAEVRDTGPGVPPAEREAIWERFYKGDRSRAGGGHGLGLPIVRGIVRAHGGEVGVEGCPEGGSVFWFTLPVAS